MKLIIPEKNAHWYTSKGQPMYEVKAKSREGMKAVTLREARELGLFPSVTTILQVIAKPALEAWKIEQGIMAALTLPRNADEGMDAFAHRVVEDMEEQVSVAADFGRKIHHGIEMLLAGNMEAAVVTDPEIQPWMDQIMKWISENITSTIGAEECFAHPMGFAGRYDLTGELKGSGVAVVDFKTQKFKNGKGPVFYDEWPLQLAAYATAVCHLKDIVDLPKLVSVVINSEKPEPPVMKIWENPLSHFSAFGNVFEVWKYMKGYDPIPQFPES